MRNLPEAQRLSYLRVLIAIAHSDGILNKEEIARIKAFAQELGFDEGEMDKSVEDLRCGVGVEEALAHADFDVSARCNLLRDAYELAWSDAFVNPAETQHLRLLVERLNLEDHAPSIHAWVERHISLKQDWARITSDAGENPKTR